MRTDSFPPADTRAYADRPATKPPNWHALVAWDMLFNNLSTGLFLVAAIGELAAPAVFRPLTKFAYPAALCFLIADLVCLTLDLGDPWRFHHMLRVFKPSSPMSLGTWCLTAFSLPLAVATACALLPVDGAAAELTRKLAVVIGLVPAAGAALYKGVLFSTTAQPGWKDMRWLGAYLASAAILLGAAGLLVISIVTGQEPAAAVLRMAAVPLLVLNCFAFALLFAGFRVLLPRADGRRRLARMEMKALAIGFGLPAVLIGLGGPAADITATVFITAAALLVRHEIVRLPHVVGERRG